MKRLLVSLIVLLSLGNIAYTQTPDSTGRQPGKINPTKQAVRQLKMLQRQLDLTEEQVTDMQVILISRDVALDSLRNNPSADTSADRRARRTINTNAEQKINSILTTDQKPLYKQWKQEQRQKMMEKRRMNGQEESAP